MQTGLIGESRFAAPLGACRAACDGAASLAMAFWSSDRSAAGAWRCWPGDLDPLLGPLVARAAGGTAVELVGDVAVRLVR